MNPGLQCLSDAPNHLPLTLFILAWFTAWSTFSALLFQKRNVSGAIVEIIILNHHCLARVCCFVPFLRTLNVTQLLGRPVFQTGSPRSGRVSPHSFPFLFSGAFLFSYLWISERLSCFVFLFFFNNYHLHNTHTHIFVCLFLMIYPKGYILVCLSLLPPLPRSLLLLGWIWICSQGWPETY